MVQCSLLGVIYWKQEYGRPSLYVELMFIRALIISVVVGARMLINSCVEV
jgi:hypothetical protein